MTRAAGVRPSGVDENIYEYDSEGASDRNRLVMNGNVHAKGLGLFGFYMLSKMNTNTAGVSTFASNSYDLHVDYGRGASDVRSRMFLGGFTQLPWKFSVNPFIIYQSSTPFNITVGQDLNGDTIFNDRPAFATDLTRSSVYKTPWGNFDAQPIAGQKIIPSQFPPGKGRACLSPPTCGWRGTFHLGLWFQMRRRLLRRRRRTRRRRMRKRLQSR